MAVAANDFQTAQQIFSEIGEDWEPGVWWNKANFEKTKESVLKHARLSTKQPASLASNSPE
jgi:hypothetical protein